MRRENLTRGNGEVFDTFAPGVVGREFCSDRCETRGLSTGTLAFAPRAELGYHTHPFSEAFTLLDGELIVAVEGRHYRMRALDSIHFPAAVAHKITNVSASARAVAHWAFANATPSFDFVRTEFARRDREGGLPAKDDPEHLSRFDHAEVYALAEGTEFRDLFAGRFGAKGICGGYGEFAPGTGLPCHLHQFDESITIVKGRATCQVAGRAYSLADYDTAMVPTGLPHRFLNEGSVPMAMVWVYAGDEPERTLVDPGYCAGTLRWTEQSST